MLKIAKLSTLFIGLVCYWQTCRVVDGQLAACGKTGNGTEAQMLVAEAVSRGPAEIFLRECVAGGKPALGWNRSGIFVRGEN